MNSDQLHLSLSNLTLTRNSVAVVTDGHLVVNRGEIVCLVGPNGSGKTSLAELLAGVSTCTASSGSLLFQGKNIRVTTTIKRSSTGLDTERTVLASAPAEKFILSKALNLLLLTPSDRARHGLYVAFQNVPEFDGVTAETFLYEAYAACSGLRLKRDEFKIRLIELCDRVGLQITHLERSLFKGFSGGERKRFQLLELLLLRPQLAILDELDAGLDAEGLQLFFDIIKELRVKNFTLEDSCKQQCSTETMSFCERSVTSENAANIVTNNTSRDEDSGTSFVVITHNQAVIDVLSPDRVYELSDHKLRKLSAGEISKKRSKEGDL